MSQLVVEHRVFPHPWYSFRHHPNSQNQNALSIAALKSSEAIPGVPCGNSPTMKRAFFLLIIVSLVLSELLGPASAGEPDNSGALPQASRFKPGEVLVKFATGVRSSQAAANLAAKGLTITGKIPSLDIKRLAVPPGQELMWIEELRDEPGLVFAEPNYLAHAAETIPDDPHYTEQWGLPRIRAPEAWDLTTGDDLIIAVIDTGVDLDHPDLVGKLWTNADEIPDNGLDDDGNGYVDDSHGWDFVNDDAEPQDDYWHGTHVAGIAAADTDNGQGVAGVSWGARIMPLKVLDASGEGSYTDVISAPTNPSATSPGPQPSSDRRPSRSGAPGGRRSRWPRLHEWLWTAPFLGNMRQSPSRTGAELPIRRRTLPAGLDRAPTS